MFAIVSGWGCGHASRFLGSLLEVGARWRLGIGDFVQYALATQLCEQLEGFAKKMIDRILMDWMVGCNEDAYLEKWANRASALFELEQRTGEPDACSQYTWSENPWERHRKSAWSDWPLESFAEAWLAVIY